MDIPLIEQTRIHAPLLVPLLRAFQSEIGPDRTSEIVRKGIRSYGLRLGQEMRSQFKGDSMEKIDALTSVSSADGALDVEVLERTPDVYRVKVTGCRYTQIYKELNATDLGFLYFCELDFPVNESLVPDMELTRTQTIMQGASHCDLCWMKKEAKTSKDAK